MKFRPLVLLSVFSLTACASALAQQDTTTVAEAEASNAETVAQALFDGFVAKAKGDANSLMRASEQLQIADARPQGGDDLGATWGEQARQNGATYQPAPVVRGRTIGPGYRNGEVSGHSAYTTQQTFNAGQRAEVYIVPLDGARLSLIVTNDEGRQICRVGASSKNFGCRFVPPYTGSNQIDIINETPETVSFYMVVN